MTRLLDEASADTQPFPRLPGAAGERHERPGPSGFASGRWAAGPRIRRWLRYTSASITAGVISTVTLLVLYGLELTSPQAASVIAFLAGAIPNYLMSRLWTWRGRGRPQPLREIMPYAAIVVTTTVTAALLTGVTDEHVHVITSLRWLQVGIVGAVFVGTYAAMFVLKFLLLDRYVFTGRTHLR